MPVLLNRVFFVALVSISLETNAGLDDKFIFSSKFGLAVESVTSNWSTLENGLQFGGNLNGVPRDTVHDLIYKDSRLSQVNIFYKSDPLYFETEKASRKWIYTATKSLIDRATKKYGSPLSSLLKCQNAENFTGCEGSSVWRGNGKVFEITLDEKPFNKYREALYGYGKTYALVISYYDADDYKMSRVRTSYLINWHNERSARQFKRYLNATFKYYINQGKSLEDVLIGKLKDQGKIKEIIRKESHNYIGGVKSNYDPKKWAKSFRLQ